MTTIDIPVSSRRPVSSRSSVEVALRYPASWFTLVNPAATAVEQWTEHWLREIGVISSDKALACFRSLAVGAYGGWPFPFVDAERLETITRFFTLWIFYDDIIEGTGEDREALLAAAIRGEPEARFGGSACIRGWWEIARRYRAVMSPAWLERHAEKYMEWLRSVRQEAPIALRYQAARKLPTVEEYMTLRRMTIGVLPTLTFIEYATLRELPDEARRHPAFGAIERLAAELVAIPNDLYGFSKDRQSTWVNAVSCMADERRVSVAEAMVKVAELHNRRVAELVDLEQAWLADMRDRSLGEEWLRKAHHIIHGFARWHEVAPRYSPVHVLDDGTRLRIAVRYG